MRISLPRKLNTRLRAEAKANLRTIDAQLEYILKLFFEAKDND